MPVHEHFEELCALAAIGQLSEGEHQELLAHLPSCTLCQRAHNDFALILDQLPSAGPHSISGDTDELLSDSCRRRFLERAAGEGISFTPDAYGMTRPRSVRFTSQRMWHIAAVPVGVLCMLALAVSMGRLGRWNKGDLRNEHDGPELNRAELRNPVPEEEQISRSSLRVPDGDLGLQVQTLKQQVSKVSLERDRLTAESADLKQRLMSLISQSELLKSQSEKSDQALLEANAELERLRGAQGEILAVLEDNGKKIKDLAAEVAADEAALNRERDLNAAATDVREFMAARNLHIIDVYDYDTRGKRDKSFGRVLYSEHKKLIFYAFDLGKSDSASNVMFQAWGQRDGHGAETKNLGVFHIDDHAQRRWVLRVDDPKLLSSIDSVFVTVEPSPGGDKPSGRKLLYAYLGADANHP
jgi:hypothetical protein